MVLSPQYLIIFNFFHFKNHPKTLFPSYKIQDFQCAFRLYSILKNLRRLKEK